MVLQKLRGAAIAAGSSVAALAFVFLTTGSASAATVNATCANFAATVAAASAGDTVVLTEDCEITTPVVVDEDITVQGADGVTITTSGSSYVFLVTADGATIDNFEIIKEDKATQNIIGVQGDNVTISNSEFSGQYTLAANDHVSRGIEVSPGVQGVVIDDNTFNNLRQPAYINDFVTGTVSDNYVNETRGFVIVANTDLTIVGNEFGTNAVDIAFIPGVPNNYSCEEVRQISKNNDNAKVENQAQLTPCPTYPDSKDACKNGGYKTFTGVTFKNQGQCVSYVNHQD